MTFSDLKTDQRLIRLSIAVILFFVLLASIYYNPVDYKITDCTIKRITGFSCPGCGLTRSFHAGANLHITRAFSFHWIGPVLLLGLVFLFLKYSLESITGKAIQFKMKPAFIKATLLITGIVWVIFWISRLMFETGGV